MQAHAGKPSNSIKKACFSLRTHHTLFYITPALQVELCGRQHGCTALPAHQHRPLAVIITRNEGRRLSKSKLPPSSTQGGAKAATCRCSLLGEGQLRQVQQCAQSVPVHLHSQNCVETSAWHGLAALLQTWGCAADNRCMCAVVVVAALLVSTTSVLQEQNFHSEKDEADAAQLLLQQQLPRLTQHHLTVHTAQDIPWDAGHAPITTHPSRHPHHRHPGKPWGPCHPHPVEVNAAGGGVATRSDGRRSILTL